MKTKSKWNDTPNIRNISQLVCNDIAVSILLLMKDGNYYYRIYLHKFEGKEIYKTMDSKSLDINIVKIEAEKFLEEYINDTKRMA